MHYNIVAMMIRNFHLVFSLLKVAPQLDTLVVPRSFQSCDSTQRSVKVHLNRPVWGPVYRFCYLRGCLVAPNPASHER